ncbi:alpha-L-rhamnosidase C-terminal domain-containing protein [Streptomyces sp. NPDC002888]|uniref:alpha-L-rhamnosidase C-terminal domain-containing protein n=1 Tax=Streptomyces sp. NPDC002888 TaxID=3364668 RepID=UPI0036C7C07B
MDWARGTFDSPRGTIAVEWRADDHEPDITVDAPPASTATAVFPHGEEITAGPGPVHLARLIAR